MEPIKNPTIKYTQLFINNQFVDATSNRTFPTVNPATGDIICQVQEADANDVDMAVKAAAAAFRHDSEWRQMDASARGQLLNKFADLIERDTQYLASLESTNNGKLFEMALVDIHTSVKLIRFYAGAADKFAGQIIPADGQVFAYTRYEPIGVCAGILPWNYPIEITCVKIAPCLAMGNCIVLKPAEQTPLTALYLASLIKEAGFPAGVVNVVTGYGPGTGQPIVEHPLVRHIAFTGSTEVGSLIQRLAAKDIKRVSLELGGKSPLIIMPDADLDKAVQVAHDMCMINQGQCCVAATRTFVHHSIYDEFVRRTVELAKTKIIGDPLDTKVTHGPQIDTDQLGKIMNLIESATKEGAKLECGGKRVDCKGYYVYPTVFSDVTDNMRIAKEEIFGPVQQLLKFSDIDEVVERANATNYGLGAGVFTNDLNTALKISARLEAGQVYVNNYLVGGVQVPFGGFKQSGIGREFGMECLKSFCEVKSVIIDLPCKI